MPITAAPAQEARRNIASVALRTPLVRLNAESPANLYLKLENLQPIGSFKIRGAANVMARTPRDRLTRGVLTASAGNMAQGVAFCARRLQIAHVSHMQQIENAIREHHRSSGSTMLVEHIVQSFAR